MGVAEVDNKILVSGSFEEESPRCVVRHSMLLQDEHLLVRLKEEGLSRLTTGTCLDASVYV